MTSSTMTMSSFLSCVVMALPAVAQSSTPITVVSHMGANTTQDWLIVCATFFGGLILIFMVLSELIRLCRMDARRRRMKNELCRAGIPLASASNTRPLAPTALHSTSFGVVNVDSEERLVKQALAASRVTAAREREERELSLAIQMSMTQLNRPAAAVGPPSRPSAPPPTYIYPGPQPTYAPPPPPQHTRSSSMPAPVAPVRIHGSSQLPRGAYYDPNRVSYPPMPDAGPSYVGYDPNRPTYPPVPRIHSYSGSAASLNTTTGSLYPSAEPQGPLLKKAPPPPPPRSR